MVDIREVVWHRDGHRVIILIDHDNVTIGLEYCPNGGEEDTECWHPEVGGCVVKYFIDLFGFDINKGMAPASLFTEISWSIHRGLDLYMSEVWIIPVEDESFSAFLEEQMEAYNEANEE